MSAIAQLQYKKLRWQRSKSSSLARQREVFLAAFTFLFFIWWDKFWQDNTSRTRSKRAEWLVRNMLELGPTFIKIGQSLSTRVDLLPPEYISTLAQLQDKVPAFSAKKPETLSNSNSENLFMRSIEILTKFLLPPLALGKYIELLYIVAKKLSSKSNVRG